MIKVFKNLQKGIQRSIIVGAIIFTILLGGILNLSDRGRITDEFLLYIIIIALPTTVVLLFAGLWIYSGFKDDKK
jgi:membrane protein DedA with SNARE-associated domain